MSELLSNEKCLKAVEKLLTQSITGVHCLFDNQSIQKAFQTCFLVTDSFELKKKKIFIKFVNCLTLKEKELYLNNLPEKDKFLLIQSYFEILDSSLKKIIKDYH